MNNDGQKDDIGRVVSVVGPPAMAKDQQGRRHRAISTCGHFQDQQSVHIRLAIGERLCDGIVLARRAPCQ